METEVKITRVVTLVLQQDEATWLKEIMQNPLTDSGNPEHEDPEDAKYRKAFFKALQNSLPI